MEPKYAAEFADDIINPVSNTPLFLTFNILLPKLQHQSFINKLETFYYKGFFKKLSDKEIWVNEKHRIQRKVKKSFLYWNYTTRLIHRAQILSPPPPIRNYLIGVSIPNPVTLFHLQKPARHWKSLGDETELTSYQVIHRIISNTENSVLLFTTGKTVVCTNSSLISFHAWYPYSRSVYDLCGSFVKSLSDICIIIISNISPQISP